MADLLFSIDVPPLFKGNIYRFYKAEKLKFLFRSYDHTSNGYCWCPDDCNVQWGFDVERMQGTSSEALSVIGSESVLLCKWTRAESVAKLIDLPIIIIWKKYRHVFLSDEGLQILRIENRALSIYTRKYKKYIFSIACYS